MSRVPSKPPKTRGWTTYHEEMTKEYRYFVRGEALEPPYALDPFYTNENIDSLRNLVDTCAYIDVFNCEWEAGDWRESPYKIRYSRRGNTFEYFAHPITKKPNHHSFKPAGVRLNGDWIEKNYYDSLGEDGFTQFNWFADGACYVVHAGSSLRRDADGAWWIRLGEHSEKIRGFPEDFLTAQARRMKAGKWNGFYDDLVDFLIADGLDSRFL